MIQAVLFLVSMTSYIIQKSTLSHIFLTQYTAAEIEENGTSVEHTTTAGDPMYTTTSGEITD